VPVFPPSSRFLRCCLTAGLPAYCFLSALRIGIGLFRTVGAGNGTKIREPGATL
jgi:hypothetical protein